MALEGKMINVNPILKKLESVLEKALRDQGFMLMSVDIKEKKKIKGIWFCVEAWQIQTEEMVKHHEKVEDK